MGFVTEDGKLKSVPIAGGAAQTICDLPVAGWSGGSEWQPDDTIYFSSKTLWRVAASGGTPQAVTTLDEKKGELSHLWPQILPGGKAVLFTISGPTNYNHHIALESLEAHQRSDLTQHGMYARYASGGYLIYAEDPPLSGSSGSLLARAFDLERLKVAGPELPILDKVWVSNNNSAQFALSASSTLVYAPGGEPDLGTLAWVDRHGNPTPLQAPLARYQWPRLSPDEQRLALTIVDGHQTDVWTYDLRRNILAQVTSDGTSDYAIWIPPDGTSLVYASRRPGPRHNLYVKAVDGTAAPVRLAPTENSQFPGSLSSPPTSCYSMSAVRRTLTGTRQRCHSKGNAQLSLLSAADQRSLALVRGGQDLPRRPLGGLCFR